MRRALASRSAVSDGSGVHDGCGAGSVVILTVIPVGVSGRGGIGMGPSRAASARGDRHVAKYAPVPLGTRGAGYVHVTTPSVPVSRDDSDDGGASPNSPRLMRSSALQVAPASVLSESVPYVASIAVSTGPRAALDGDAGGSFAPGVAAHAASMAASAMTIACFLTSRIF